MGHQICDFLKETQIFDIKNILFLNVVSFELHPTFRQYFESFHIMRFPELFRKGAFWTLTSSFEREVLAPLHLF